MMSSPDTVWFISAGTLFKADNIYPKGKQVKSNPTQDDFEKELNAIVNSAEATSTHEPVLMDRWRAQALDCHLYA